MAAVCALGGLGFFVLVVGPDASVLRAALMGSIGLMALAGGRPGRGLSFLCLAVICLLLVDPALGSSYGFILSVLATLGIVTIGQQLVKWTPRIVPRWAAAGLAVPLSAQLLCSPVIVLLQPQFSPFALVANIVASPFVGPVTILGTVAVPVLALAPPLGGILVFIAGFFANCVAGTARFFASLPGASLPWPEGIFGLSTMLLLSALTLVMVWVLVRPRPAFRLVLATHQGTVVRLKQMEDWSRTWGRAAHRRRMLLFHEPAAPQRLTSSRCDPGPCKSSGEGSFGYPPLRRRLGWVGSGALGCPLGGASIGSANACVGSTRARRGATDRQDGW